VVLSAHQSLAKTLIRSRVTARSGREVLSRVVAVGLLGAPGGIFQEMSTVQRRMSDGRTTPAIVGVTG
jgi:hypothetical protein